MKAKSAPEDHDSVAALVVELDATVEANVASVLRAAGYFVTDGRVAVTEPLRNIITRAHEPIVIVLVSPTKLKRRVD